MEQQKEVRRSALETLKPGLLEVKTNNATSAK